MQDLSSLAKGSLSMGCSMAAGNTISDPPWGGAVGSVSEATADLPYQPKYNSPELVIGSPSPTVSHGDTEINDTGVFTATPRTWKDCP